MLAVQRPGQLGLPPPSAGTACGAGVQARSGLTLQRSELQQQAPVAQPISPSTGLSAAASASHEASADAVQPMSKQSAGGAEQDADQAGGHRALSVTELKTGDKVFVLQQPGARHTGISIQESIIER